MGTELESLSKRLQKVERQNRTLRITAVAALALIGGVVLVGAAAPKPKTVEAEKFVVLDEQGRKRAELGMSEENSVGLALSDKKGERRAALRLTRLGRPSLVLQDAHGDERAKLDLGVEPSLTLSDKTGAVRLNLGINIAKTRDLRETPSFRLFGAQGKVIWEAP